MKWCVLGFLIIYLVDLVHPSILKNIQDHSKSFMNANLDISGREYVQVNIYSPSRRRKRELSSDSKTLEIIRSNGNSTMHIKLSENTDLLSSDFTFSVRDENGRQVVSTSDQNKNCFFSGNVEVTGSGETPGGNKRNVGNAVLSACGDSPGFTGIIETDDGNFVLEPSGSSSSNSEERKESQNLEINSESDVDPNVSRTLISDDEENNVETISYTLTPQKESFEEGKMSKCIKPPNPVDSEVSNTDYENPIVKNGIRQSVKMSWTGSQQNNDVIHDVNKDGRPVVELMVFADQAFYKYAEPEVKKSTLKTIKNYIVNLVAISYKHPSLKTPIFIRLVGVEIFKKNPTKLNTANGNVATYLDSWADYQSNLNPEGDKFDHAMLLTALDIGLKDDRNIIGFAYVSAMCSPSVSASIVKVTSFFSANVMTHELGHSLGMGHDGNDENKKCDGSRFMMAARTGEKQITWSTCSNENLVKYLATPIRRRSGASKCLLEPPVDRSKKGAIRFNRRVTLPGQSVTANQQCFLVYGSSYPYSVVSKNEFQIKNFDFCKEMWCKPRERVRSGDQARFAHPPLDGTDCGSGKWCRFGNCVDKTTRKTG